MRTPITIKMVCTKSVQITADSPPAMQKNPAIANKTKIDKYNPESPANPIAYLMNNAPAYKSAYIMNYDYFWREKFKYILPRF